MKFLIDRCAGRRLTDWLCAQGHDARHVGEMGEDPGDKALLQWAAAEGRVLVTIDTDFGTLVFLHNQQHAGLVRLPDVPVTERIRLMSVLLEAHSESLERGSVITVRGDRIRVSKRP